jgi:hypothetical protein
LYLYQARIKAVIYFCVRDIYFLYFYYYDFRIDLTVWYVSQSDSVVCFPFYLNIVLSSFMTYHRISNKSNPTSVTSGTGTAYLPKHLTCSPLVLSGVRVAQSLVFCVVLCRSSFVPFLLAIALSVLSLRIMMAHLVSSNFVLNCLAFLMNVIPETDFLISKFY